MKIQKNQNKIKGAYKQNYSTKIYPNNQLNYKETNEGENLEFQDEQEYEEEEQIDYQKQCYIQPIRSREEFYEKENSNDKQPNFQNIFKIDRNSEKGYYNSIEYKPSKNQNTKNNQNFSDFNNIQKSVELEKKYYQKSGNSLKCPKLTNMNEKCCGDNINDKNRNIERNSDSFQNRKNEERNVKDLKYSGKNKKYEKNNQDYDDEQEQQEFTPKYYRNNPLVKKGNIQRQKLYMGNREENPLKSVAQKICNIVIKEDKKNKNKKNKENNTNSNDDCILI